MALGRLTSFTFGTRFLTLVYDNAQTFYASYAHIIGFESDPRSGDLTIYIYTAGEISETLSVRNTDLVAIGSSAAAFLALFNQNIQPYSYWENFLDSTTAGGALPSEPSALRGQCLYARFQPIYNFGSASLINVPAKFKAGTLYSQVPDTGAGDFTVTRATTPTAGRSTRINKDGLIELVADNVPRLDYPLGGAVNGCPALLVEPSAQNLAFHSTDWTSNWGGGSASGTTITTGSTAAFTAPDGTTTANEIHPTSGSTNHVRQSNSTTEITYTSGTIYTQSAFFKAGVGVGDKVQLTYSLTRFSQGGYANFDLTNGLVSVVSGTSADSNRAARIENYGNGWYRCIFVATCNSAGTGAGVNPVLIQASGDARAPSFAGTITDYVLGWGAQLETGSVATSYIPTTTQAITRAADVVSKTGVGSLIGQSEGTIYLDLTVLSKGGTSSAGRWLQIFGASNNIGLAINSSNQFRSIVNTQSDTLTTAPLISSGVKVAWAYDGTGTTCFINGTQYTLTNGGNQTMSSLTSISIDGSANTALGFARIRAVALYTTRLTNAQLAALTAP